MLSNWRISQFLLDADLATDPKENGLLDQGDLSILIGNLAQAVRELLDDAEQVRHERDELASWLSTSAKTPDSPHALAWTDSRRKNLDSVAAQNSYSKPPFTLQPYSKSTGALESVSA